MPPKGNGPPEREEPGPTPETGPNHKALADTTTNNNILPNTTCRCAYGEVCVCDWYAGWVCDCNFPQDIPTQLKRRSAAALRMMPDHSGRRDPISARLGRWAA